MKQLSTHCQVCRKAMTIEVEEPALFSDEWMIKLATCDSCLSDHPETDRNRIAKFHLEIEREERQEVRKPYAD